MSNIYLGTINAGGDGRAILLAAINSQLSTSYTLVDFDFGLPSAVAIPTPSHNSQIAFGPKLGTGYYGVRTIFYNRIHASDLGAILVAFDGEMYVSELLNKINTKYGIYITAADIYDAVIPSPANGVTQVAVALEFRPESVIFYAGATITVGQNDPTGDTVPTLPFEASHTFVFNQVQSVPTQNGEMALLEPFSLSVDRDRVRQHVALIGDDLYGNNTAAHTRTLMTAGSFESRKKNLPFIGMWTEPVTGRTMAVGPLGDVYRANTDGTNWEYLASGLGYDITNEEVIVMGYATPYVKAVAQAEDGVTYFLAKGIDGTPRVYSTATSQTVWTPVSVSTTRMFSLTTAGWDSLEIFDALHTGGKFYILLKANSAYEAHATKGVATPSLEILDTASGTVDYYPLGNTKITYSDIELFTTSPKARWRIVTPIAGAPVVDVVALLQSLRNNNSYVVFYKHTAGEYTATVLPHSYLGGAQALQAEMDVCAYQLPVTDLVAKIDGVAVTGHYLDVVEIAAPTEISAFNRYFLKTGVRSQQNYLSYGVKVMTSVATRTARTPWFESSLNLTSSQKPEQVVLQCKGTRNHVLFQNATAMHRLRLRQGTGTAQFSAELDSSVVLGTHAGFGEVCRIGAGVFTPVTVIDSPVDFATLTADQNFEGAMAAIGYSFIVKGADNSYGWLTATAADTALTPRAPSRNYAFMGTTPCLVAGEGANLLYWSPMGNGVFKSVDAGLSWNEYNAAPAFYSQEQSPLPALNIRGTANITLRAEHFLESTLVNGKLIVETKVSDSANVYDVAGGQVNAAKVLSDNMLYSLDSTIVTEVNTYTESGVQTGYGLNLLSLHSPRQIVAWDSDINNAVETIGYSTAVASAPLAVKHNFDNYMFTLPGTLVDFSRDVSYLGFRHWILVNNNDVWNLHFVSVVEPELTIGLFGSANTALASFKPEVSFHLWDYEDVPQSYMPYVFYGNKRVLLLERLDSPKVFATTQHILNIPDDNGLPLTPIKMHNANRRDYLFAQKGNGIFRLVYTWDGIGRISTIVLQKLFSLTSVALSGLTFISGCKLGVTARTAPMEVLIPDNLPADTVIGWYCYGTTRTNRFANGSGGFYETTVPQSFDCGYVEPAAPGDAGGVGGGTP